MEVIGQHHIPSRFTPLKKKPVPFEYELRWVLGPGWTLWRSEKFLAPKKIRTVNRTAFSLVALPATLFQLPQYWWRVTQLRSMQIVTNPFRLRARKLANQNRVHKPNTQT
jgi:hypothetical protein